MVLAYLPSIVWDGKICFWEFCLLKPRMGREVSEHFCCEGLMSRFWKHAVNEQTYLRTVIHLILYFIFQEKQNSSLPSFIQQCNNSNWFLLWGHRMQLIPDYKNVFESIKQGQIVKEVGLYPDSILQPVVEGVKNETSKYMPWISNEVNEVTDLVGAKYSLNYWYLADINSMLK